MEILDIKYMLTENKNLLEELKKALKIEEKKDRIIELENLSATNGFWDDIQNSQKVSKETKDLKQAISFYQKTENEYLDVNAMFELYNETQDEEIGKELQSEISKLNENVQKLKIASLLSSQYDDTNAIVTIHSGAGGTEAQDWVQMLYRMYQKWVDKAGFELEVFDILEGEEAGIKSITFTIKGINAYGYMKSEKGVHRLVRISPFDANKRRHTSFASVEVMPEMAEDIDIEIRPEDLEVDTYRASGAGGQHINKTDSAVRMKHIPTGIVVSCQTQRSQIQNRETCLKMLKSKLYIYEKEKSSEKLKEIKGEMLENGFGSQIRSYVFCPYTLVKDHRTGFEVGNVQAVMDGELDGFIFAYLKNI